MSKISPLAYIHPEAIIGENCEIGAFCYIDKGVYDQLDKDTRERIPNTLSLRTASLSRELANEISKIHNM